MQLRARACVCVCALEAMHLWVCQHSQLLILCAASEAKKSMRQDGSRSWDWTELLTD